MRNTTALNKYPISVFYLVFVSVLVLVQEMVSFMSVDKKTWSNGNGENKGHKQNQKTSGEKQNVKQRNLMVYQMYNRSKRCEKWLFVAGLTYSLLQGAPNALEY